MTRLSDQLRTAFDRAAARVGAAGLVILLFVFTASMAAFLYYVLHRDCDVPPDILQVELAFTASRYHSLLDSGSDKLICRDNVIDSLYWDCAFPLGYAPLMAAIFWWLERWRRSAPRSVLRDLFLVSPLIAGLLDLVENAGLAVAAVALPEEVDGAYSGLVHLGVAVGSSASAAKWLLLLIAIAGIFREAVARATSTSSANAS